MKKKLTKKEIEKMHRRINSKEFDKMLKKNMQDAAEFLEKLRKSAIVPLEKLRQIITTKGWRT